MEKPKVNIDSWEPSDEHKFVYPKGKELLDSKKIEEELTPKLIKALKDGLGDSLPGNK